jgi:Ion channel
MERTREHSWVWRRPVDKSTLKPSFYHLRGCLPDAEAAFYFSGVTYTTVGYGELVLTKPWRLLAPIETLTGILMCGLSASFFFAVVVGIDRARPPDNYRRLNY